jgi:dCTP diphosphatase
MEGIPTLEESSNFDLEDASEAIAKFVNDRGWEQFHTPRNLMLALVGEIGELAELMQWRTEQEFLEFWKSPEGGIRVREEFADIMIYLIRIAQVIGINPSEAVFEKLERNEARFPISEAYGHAYRPEQ